ncbi:hypothetical protein Tsubulata_014152 [Turnera subulata]|uniref:Sm domain-containing protein n=1 Tax=Turnera subulata TaxID=218843 RepID=A0A9Q0J1V5_9ROSI|nr:hypothetical protein Tsubulata_014152 [Turnera subulata]
MARIDQKIGKRERKKEKKSKGYETGELGLLEPGYPLVKASLFVCPCSYQFKYMDMEQGMEMSSTQLTTSEGSNPANSDPIARVRKLLFRRMLVGIKDGRFFLGTFHCIDKQGNIILQDTVEYRSTRRSSPSPMEQRCLGIILIPSSCRTSCHRVNHYLRHIR